jgi:hypothetical protein
MRARSIALLTLVLGSLGIIRFAVAQQAGAQPTDDEEAVVEGTARRRADLTPTEQLAEAQRIQERGQQLSRRVTGMLDEARRENDVMRVTCLDDKLTQINAHLRTLGSRVNALREAVQLGDEGRRNHEYTIIAVLAQNLSELERAANECIGQDLFETGTIQVTTTIDPTVSDVDPSDIGGLRPRGPWVDIGIIPPPATFVD